MSSPSPSPNQQRTKPTPDLIDVFLILLLSAAITLFVFWIASQSANNPVFAQLPPYIATAFSSIWASAATGTAGIGLVIIKALSNNTRPTPNYLLYILATTALIFISVLILGNIFNSKSDSTPIDPPYGATLIDTTDTSDTRDLDLVSHDNVFQGLELKGTYNIKDGKISGKVTGGTYRTYPAFVPPMNLRQISVQLCYIHKIQGVQGFEGKIGMQNFPPEPKASNSIDIDISLDRDKSYDLPSFDFKFNLPPDFVKNKGWLCGAAYNDHGGYFPAY